MWKSSSTLNFFLIPTTTSLDRSVSEKHSIWFSGELLYLPTLCFLLSLSAGLFGLTGSLCWETVWGPSSMSGLRISAMTCFTTCSRRRVVHCTLLTAAQGGVNDFLAPCSGRSVWAMRWCWFWLYKQTLVFQCTLWGKACVFFLICGCCLCSWTQCLLSVTF